jgi:hypothetical protein
MGEVDQLDENRLPEGQEKKMGFKGGKRKCKFSSICKKNGDRKIHQLFMITEEPRLLKSPSSLLI